MDQQYLRQFEQLCTQESPPACQTMCPLHVETRTFLDLMGMGKLRDARKCLERTMPLSSLVGLLCEGHCLAHCARGRVDEPINVPLAEKACVLATSPGKPFPLPGSGKNIAIAGATLSGFSAVHELAKKGHAVTLFFDASEGEAFGALLLEEFSACLERGVLEKAVEESLAQLKALRVVFTPTLEKGADFLNGLGQEFSAVYMGLDASQLLFSSLKDLQDYAPIDGFTLQCAKTQYFVGIHETYMDEARQEGTRQEGAGLLSPIERVAMGKRAAASIDRFLQGVDPATAREAELVQPTKLYTNTADVAPLAAVIPADRQAPTAEEGQAEANRCIRCSCLECVKHCSFLAAYKTYPKKLAREIYNNLAVIKGFRQTNQAINSCTECGLCAAVCPNNADMGAFCATARKKMVHDKRMPPSAHEFALLDMEQSNEAEVAFFRHQPDFSSSAYLFFPGCQLPASLPKETLWAYELLCDKLTGGVGLYFHCCGAPARWSGRERLTQTTARMLEEQWEASGKPQVIVACASCFEFFTAELPHIPCRSLWDVLDEIVVSHGPFETCFTPPIPLALHDPCAARGQRATQQAVRRILTKNGVPYEELGLRGSLTRCCGYGGLAASANPSLGAGFARVRADDSPLPMVAYCAVCRERLAAEGKGTVHLLELLYGIDDMEKALGRRPLGISARQYARKSFRENALKDMWNEDSATEAPCNFTLTYAEGVAMNMEQRRIREADVAMVLEHARAHGPLFKDPDNQWALASLRPKQVTFWVRYTETGPDSYRVHDAYCHRMLVPGIPGEGKDTPCTLEGFSGKAVC